MVKWEQWGNPTGLGRCWGSLDALTPWKVLGIAWQPEQRQDSLDVGRALCQLQTLRTELSSPSRAQPHPQQHILTDTHLPSCTLSPMASVHQLHLQTPHTNSDLSFSSPQLLRLSPCLSTRSRYDFILAQCTSTHSHHSYSSVEGSGMTKLPKAGSSVFPIALLASIRIMSQQCWGSCGPGQLPAQSKGQSTREQRASQQQPPCRVRADCKSC